MLSLRYRQAESGRRDVSGCRRLHQLITPNGSSASETLARYLCNERINCGSITERIICFRGTLSNWPRGGTHLPRYCLSLLLFSSASALLDRLSRCGSWYFGAIVVRVCVCVLLDLWVRLQPLLCNEFTAIYRVRGEKIFFLCETAGRLAPYFFVVLTVVVIICC